MEVRQGYFVDNKEFTLMYEYNNLLFLMAEKEDFLYIYNKKTEQLVIKIVSNNDTLSLK